MITVRFMNDFSKTELGYLEDEEQAIAIRREIADDGYTVAAIIDTSSLELAYKLMQNGVVTDSWTFDPPPGLTPISPPLTHNGRLYGNRSASMGDLFEMDDGTLFVCADFGFNKLDFKFEDGYIHQAHEVGEAS